MSATSGNSSVRYHLRYQIAPEQDVEGMSHALVTFCKEHGVEEVALFFNAEDWNTGILSSADVDRWFGAVATATGILKDAGITVSLNPWATVLHTDRGRKLAPEYDFELMESPIGERAESCVSFADPAWQDYIAELYGRFAELGFRVLWVEDDFRFHNHAPPLEWGGGFEPAVRKRFAGKVGRDVPREEIVAALLQPGEPHPWRSVWIETWREIHLEVAGVIAGAVEERAPNEAVIGLMTSHPSTHSVEGRRWDKLFDAFTINGGFAHRPHFASYSETTGKGRAHPIMMLDLQRRYWREHVEIAPEIENFPFSMWNKSETQTWCEMALAHIYGADAMFLDLFPFTGGPATEEPGMGRLLDGARPGLAWLGEHFSRGAETCGVGLPWREDAAERVHTESGTSVRELEVDPFGAGHLFIPYGIPISVSEQPVNALFGRMAWVPDDEEMERMLSGGLILDGTAADILTQRGYGDDIGVRFEGWMERDTSLYAIEQVVSEQSGAPVGRTLNNNLVPRIAHLEPVDGAVEWSALCDPWLKRVGAGMVAYENARGGRVVTFSAPDPQSLTPSYERQAMVQQSVEYAGRGTAPGVRVTGSPHLMPMDFQRESGRAIAVVNGFTDPGRATIHVKDAPNTSPAVTILAPMAEPRKASATVTAGDGETVFEIDADIPSQGFAVLEW